MVPPAHPRRYRSVFLSDLHLGAPACRADALLELLGGLQCERLYLLGDVVDGWKLSRRWWWPDSHAAVLDHIVRLAAEGTEVVYLPGNHDAFARAWCGSTAAGVRIVNEAVHQAADGRRYLLTHGDLYDPGAERSRVARMAGDLLYRALLRADGAARRVRRTLGLDDRWSLVAAAKNRLPLTVQVISAFEARLAAEAGARGLDGVVCGHIHSAAAREVGGVAYVNCGDWVESLTFAAEHSDGALRIVRPPAAVRARRSCSLPGFFDIPGDQLESLSSHNLSADSAGLAR